MVRAGRTLRDKVLDNVGRWTYRVPVNLAPFPPPNAPQPDALHQRAMENLRFIRATMERAGSFTAVPGYGGVLMGGTALIAAVLAARQPTDTRWLMVWMGCAVIAVAIGSAAMVLKARNTSDLLAAPGRRFALSFVPPMLAGLVLTVALFERGAFDLMPGVWLLHYGLAVAAGGMLSVRAVPIMGFCFLFLGAIALLGGIPRDVVLAIGFGLFQVGFGAWIARYHGG